MDRFWRKLAACRDEDPELFFAWDEDDIDAAKAICAGCPVIRPCLDYALKHEKEGVWGGTTEDERKRIRKSHGIRLEPVRMVHTRGCRTA